MEILPCRGIPGDQMNWTLGQIWVYPIKSLPGVAVKQSEISPAGNLRHDREFALFDTDLRIVNAKRLAAFHQVRAVWDLDRWLVSLSTNSNPAPQWFHLDQDRQAIGEWLSQSLGISVHLMQQVVGGYPDDREASGPTVISTATLKAVAEWFPSLTVDEIRRRFRANLELEGGDAFSEDRLFAGPGEQVEFKIGTATLLGTNPCQRCVVPTRASTSGEALLLFQKRFGEQRRATASNTSQLGQSQSL